MSIFEDTNPRALKELLVEIHSGTTVLPDFQRDFVWEPVPTQELIVSIANNYPAGSLLRVRDIKGLFACREFEGAPKLNGRKHTFLVLDGQQRLTSLYQAFYGVGEHRYFLDLRKLTKGADFEEAIFHERATTKRARALQDFDVQAREMILPLSVLKNGTGGFLGWLMQVTNPLSADERRDMQDALMKINQDWISTIDDYHFPVVTLSQDTATDALCTIFETLNRTGVKLGPFELLTARYWPLNVNLRELWAKARAEHPAIEAYDVDPYYVMQIISLLSRSAPSIKRSDVMELTADEVKNNWDSAVRGLAAGLEILRDDCHAVLPKWLPYQTMLVPLAGVLAKVGIPQGPEAGVHREKLKKWFWCSVFGQTYESHATSQSARDFADLLTWLSGGSPPEAVEKPRFDPRDLRDVTPRQRAIYSGAICLILKNGARDFHTQAVITGKLMTEQAIDDHHIFPAKFLEESGIGLARRRDCILNRTLIDGTTNKMIGKRPPSEYMRDIRNTTGFPFGPVLDSHLLPSGDSSPFWRDDFEAFLEWRQAKLWEEIKKATGSREPSDLESTNGEAR